MERYGGKASLELAVFKLLADISSTILLCQRNSSRQKSFGWECFPGSNTWSGYTAGTLGLFWKGITLKA